MRTLLVDNYDSYTHNVLQLLAAVSGTTPEVIHNDAARWADLAGRGFDAIVLSPGPGHPGQPRDFGVCEEILRRAELPVLGICLGHQGLGLALGGRVERAPQPMHGRLSRIEHTGTGLFAGIPQGFSAVRYHSLAVAGELGPEAVVTARAEDGTIMGLEHRSRPLWGVQFHPESIWTEHGEALVRNFYALARRHHGAAPPGCRRGPRPSAPTPPTAAARRARGGRALPVGLRSVDGEPPAEALFADLFATSEHSFWLDSADAPSRLARCSYMGSSVGAGACLVEYEAGSGVVGRPRLAGLARADRESIFDFLERQLGGGAEGLPGGVPYGPIGGFVGYLGYGCKADCGSPNAHRSDLPDAVFMRATRVVAIDHLRRRTHLLALGDGEEERRWLAAAETLVRDLLGSPRRRPAPPAPAPPPPPAAGEVVFRCGRGRSRYLADVESCRRELAAGNSYEICLTDQISIDASPDPVALHAALRRRNPAPFAALLQLGEAAVASSSPERFLAVDRSGRVEARPIKGTAPRGTGAAADRELARGLLADEKTRAEHLMIVDLLRNDLGRVCEIGSVEVPELMAIESYPTVHQVVSTISGALPPEVSAVGCARACFPGGSMTGAPKLRTMEIIDALEEEARGPYAGALGYFAADGSADLSIVIRSAVVRPGRTTIGSGGAIVSQSRPAEEFEEVLVKAEAPLAAVAEALTGVGDAPWRLQLEPDAAGARE